MRRSNVRNVGLTASVILVALFGCGDVSPTEGSELSVEGEPQGTAEFNATFNLCPEVNFASASETRAPVGGSVTLAVAAFDPEGDPIEYVWSAPTGVLSSPSASETEFTCDTEVNTTVEVRVSDDAFVVCRERWSAGIRCGGPAAPPVCEDVSVEFLRIDADRNLEGGDRGKEVVARITPGDPSRPVEDEIVAATTRGGGRVQDLADGIGTFDVMGYKTRSGLTSTLATGSVIDAAGDLVREGLRFNQNRFGLDKSGARKNEGFPGDEGETGGAKDLNPNELLLLTIAGPTSSFDTLTLDILARDSDGIVSGRVLLLEIDGTTLRVEGTVPFGPGSGVLTPIILPPSSRTDAVGLIVADGDAARIGVSFGASRCE